MRATIQQDSEGILRKQSEKKSHVRLRLHLSEETRLKLTESRAIEIASLWTWSSRAIEIASLWRNKAQAYRADDCVADLSSDEQVYGALYSGSNMYVFDVILHQLQEIENEKAFESKNNIAFSSLISLD